MTITLPVEGQTNWDDPLNLVLSKLGAGFLPDDHGYASWAFDPALCVAQDLAINGTIYLVRQQIRQTVQVDSLHYGITAAGVTPTAGQNWAGLYSSAGTRLVNVGIDAQVATTGVKDVAFTPQVLAPGFYWAALLFNAATAPTIARGYGHNTIPNAGLTAAQSRFGTGGTAQTTLPASITPASIGVTTRSHWMALGL